MAALIAYRLAACTVQSSSSSRIAIRCMSTLEECTKNTNELNDVKVTLSSDMPTSSSKSFFIHSNNESMKLVERLLLRTSNILDPHAANVVAYSGGVDSSLVAALVVRAFANYNHGQRQGSVQAVLGISPAVPKSQIIMARTVAKTIGIPLNEVSTSEGNDETYQKNEGYACFVCKTHLYSTLKTVANEAMKLQHTNGKEGLQHHQSSNPFILYNGTNADDTIDPTRLGLLAASNFSVHSPLDQITKDEVRQAAKYLNLPNWNAAASPCLRSRLAMGVMATKDHLRAVELAEEFVRSVLELDETVNARVRMLAGGRAMVELDNLLLDDVNNNTGLQGDPNWATTRLQEFGFEQRCIEEWGFESFGGVRAFKTGSVAAIPKEGIHNAHI